MRPQLISQMKGTMPAAPHLNTILVTPAPPDNQGQTGDGGRKTGKNNLAAGELIR